MAETYKDTLNLPRTDFPMRAGLPQREPERLARWEEIGIYPLLRERAKGLALPRHAHRAQGGAEAGRKIP
jgi:isoleucyl-tRNA synthetase